jgi:DNA-binding GntR family transcriptional regulator
MKKSNKHALASKRLPKIEKMLAGDEFLVSRADHTLRSMTVVNLRRAIFSLYFKPGDRLTERGLCELTGVSRSLMREALRDLEAQGLILNEPHRSPVVATLTKNDAREIYECRSALEPMAARLFVDRASDQQVLALNALATRCHKAMETQNVLDVIDSLERFYCAIFEGAGNRTATLLFRTLNTKASFLRALTFQQQSNSDTNQSINHTKRIVAAIMARDPEAAAEACLSQVKRSWKVAMNLLQEPRLDA